MTLLILIAAATLLFSFFCSISEAVLLSVTSPYIVSMEQKGGKTGKTLRKFKDDINRPLSAILTLNTIANTIGPSAVGAQATIVFSNVYPGPGAGFAIATGTLTILILIFSEIIPKTLGAVYWRQLAPVLAPLIHSLVILFIPFVFLSKLLTMGIANAPKLKGFSREEFAAMADLGAKEGQLEAKESKILKNLFRFRSTRIDNIMTPRTVVFALQENMTIAEFFEVHHQTPFSRIPIYSRDRDDITGFVLKDDILLAQARDMNDSRLHEFKREIGAVSSHNSLSEVFEFMLDRKEHIALVVDEYGMDGIVTLEDVVETLFGLEIVDEADETVDMQALARALWEKRARRIGLLADETKPEETAAEEKPEELPENSDDPELGNRVPFL